MRREMVPRKARLIAVRIDEDGLGEHPIEMLIAVKLYLEVVRSRLVILCGGNTASIEAVIVVSRPPAV